MRKVVVEQAHLQIVIKLYIEGIWYAARQGDYHAQKNYGTDRKSDEIGVRKIMFKEHKPKEGNGDDEGEGCIEFARFQDTTYLMKERLS